MPARDRLARGRTGCRSRRPASPTWHGARVAELRAACSTELGASTLITARSVDGSVPTSVRVVASSRPRTSTEIELAPSTTCSFVTMWPSSSRRSRSREPAPAARRGRARAETLISTTPWWPGRRSRSDAERWRSRPARESRDRDLADDGRPRRRRRRAT